MAKVVTVLDTESPIHTFLFFLYIVVGWRQGRALGNEEVKVVASFAVLSLQQRKKVEHLC